MTIYEFAPARLSESTQKVLRWLVAAVTLSLLAGGFALSWPHNYPYWVQVSLIVFAVALASGFVYRVSSIDQLFAFGLTASLLSVLGPFDNPVFSVSVWSLGVLIGHLVMRRDLFTATLSTLYLWGSAVALVTVWQGTEAWLAPYERADNGLLGLLTSLHLPQIVLGLIAFYIARTCIATVQALVLTRLTLKEILLRVSWVRVGVMLTAECIIASVVNNSSAFLNNSIFQQGTPYGRTILIIVISTTIFGISAERQARTARHRVNSLVDATMQLPWPENSPAHEQAAVYARQALPEFQVSTHKPPHSTPRDHIRSIPIKDDLESYTLVAVRNSGQPPFRIEDQRALSAIAQVANETIRGRKEVHRLRRLANTDRLTGLLNYRAFQVTLDELSERHNPDNLAALIFIDIDNFKAINDNYGHEAGNSVLKTVAARMQAAVTAPSLVSRVGGDEFVVLLQHLSSHAEAEAVQRRLTEQVALPIELEEATISVRLSQGIAFSTPGQQDISSLVELADRRMYESRGNRLDATADPEAETETPTVAEPSIVLALREGILQKRLKLVYQPIIDLHSDQIIAVEALMRYTDPVHGNVPVALVLSEAERLGLLPALSEQLLELAMHTLEHIRERFPDLRRVHLNISLAQLIDERFTHLVNELTELHPEFDLVLEVNENSLRDSCPSTIEQVEAFSNKSHAHLAIDDIGKTYTGLASLRDYPFVVWKVDFGVMQNFRHERSETLVRGLLNIANELRVDMVFEGVETEAQHDWLVALGAQFAQGYYYGRPVSVDELLLRFETAGLAARL